METKKLDLGCRVSALEKNFTEDRTTIRELQTEVQALKTSVEKARNSHMPKIDSLLSDRKNTVKTISTVSASDVVAPISAVAPAGNSQVKEENKLPVTSSAPTVSVASVFEAAEIGDIENLLGHLKAGTSANKRNEKGFTLLHLAVLRGEDETVKALLDAGATVNAKAPSYRTSLHLAAEKGFLNIVQMLLDAGADSNAKDTGHVTPLMLAAKAGCGTDIVKFLIDKGASLNVCDREGKTPLWYAVNSEANDIAKHLCVEGASVDSGVCPLILASETGNAEAVMLMLQCKNPANNIKLRDALSVAKDVGVVLAFEDVIPEILKTAIGVNALMWAAYHGRVHSLKALLDAGVYVNARDSSKNTALYYAIQNNRTECIELLLERGAK